ncbi:2493_t:CDS:2 [Entrophospora sp. SA101]|nr:2493_t:CDS:2 [Entrophospora sp. SA101]
MVREYECSKDIIEKPVPFLVSQMSKQAHEQLFKLANFLNRTHIQQHCLITLKILKNSSNSLYVTV